MPDYNKAIYNFIKEQIGDVKYAYARDYNARSLKVLAEERYNFPKMALNQWEFALTWAMADTFNGSCEVEKTE